MITDLTYLRNMSGDSPEIIKEMITIFVDQANEYVVEMQKYLDEKDYVSLGRLAHKAKSSIAIMGMSDLANHLKTLELNAKEGKEIDTYPESVRRFIDECTQGINELNEIAAGL